jgi:hypothetical protein
MSFLTHTPFCAIEGSEYDFEDDMIGTYTNESNPSSMDFFDQDEHLKLNAFNPQQYWGVVARKFKEYITSTIPSSEYDVCTKNSSSSLLTVKIKVKICLTNF